jgi:hypothetical protein
MASSPLSRQGSGIDCSRMVGDGSDGGFSGGFKGSGFWTLGGSRSWTPPVRGSDPLRPACGTGGSRIWTGVEVRRVWMVEEVATRSLGPRFVILGDACDEPFDLKALQRFEDGASRGTGLCHEGSD